MSITNKILTTMGGLRDNRSQAIHNSTIDEYYLTSLALLLPDVKISFSSCAEKFCKRIICNVSVISNNVIHACKCQLGYINYVNMQEKHSKN